MPWMRLIYDTALHGARKLTQQQQCIKEVRLHQFNLTQVAYCTGTNVLEHEKVKIHLAL